LNQTFKLSPKPKKQPKTSRAPNPTTDRPTLIFVPKFNHKNGGQAKEEQHLIYRCCSFNMKTA